MRVGGIGDEVTQVYVFLKHGDDGMKKGKGRGKVCPYEVKNGFFL